MPGEMSLFNQAAEMVLQRVPAGAGDTNHIGHRDAAMLADVVDDLKVQLGQGGDHYPLALHLGRKPTLLLLQNRMSHGCQLGAALRRVPCVWRSAR